ncbi:MAG: DUF4147 domain-containing protein [Candidatus Eremiobacteraeota bacterium]|nr:DUF4147 domain-containing protein [Candidatus Eremiobacteraeota bacterium]
MKSQIDFLQGIYYRALDKADIAGIIRKTVKVEGESLFISGVEFPLEKYSRILVVGVGTAASVTGRALEVILGDRISQGIVIVPLGYGEKLEKIRVREVTSPLIDKTSSRAVSDLLFIAEKAKKDDLVLFILSKGASELFEKLPDMVSIMDYRKLITRLQSVGARKDEINAVKMHISRIKGGQFINYAFPATLVTLIISDEPGGDLWRTYQAPTYFDPTTYDYCRQVLIKYRLPLKLPTSILNYFEKGIRKKISETIKEDDEKLKNVYNFVIKDSSSFTMDANNIAVSMGYSSSILSTCIDGDAVQLGRFFGGIILNITETGHPIGPPCTLIASGRLENSEMDRLEKNCALALSCASIIEGLDSAYFLAGSSFHFEKGGFSGCMVDGDTVTKIKDLNIDPMDLIRERKAKKVLDNLGQLLPAKFNAVDCGDLFVMMVVK